MGFNDVRIEMSQSVMPDYSMYGWVRGISDNISNISYSPINILSSGSRWEDINGSNPKRIDYTNYSMSAWYSYDGTLYIETDITGTLYNHIVPDTIRSKTMLPINAGLSDKRIDINISGSIIDDLYSDWGIDVWYGKPWNNNGSYIAGGVGGDIYNNTIRQHVTYSYFGPDYTNSIDFSYSYDYTYDSNKGQYLYVVLTGGYGAY